MLSEMDYYTTDDYIENIIFNPIQFKLNSLYSLGE